MPKTNFRDYKLLIDTLYEYRDSKWGPTVMELLQHYQDSAEEIGAVYVQNNVVYGRYKISRETLISWRARILELYGIFIGPDRDSRHYKIKNPELLYEPKTIRYIIDKLADDEAKGFPEASLKQTNNSNFYNLTSFISNPISSQFFNSKFGYEEEEPDMVSIIRFCMTVGEALVIKYSKMVSLFGRDYKKPPFVLKPQQLKQINGRWYVAGYLYEYGHPNMAQTAIYDVARIKLYDDDLDIPHYNIDESFDIYKIIREEYSGILNPDKVVSICLRVYWGIFQKLPFTPAQMSLKPEKGSIYNEYEIFILPNEEFFIQLSAYGDEVTLLRPKSDCEQSGIGITVEQVAKLKEAKERFNEFSPGKIYRRIIRDEY